MADTIILRADLDLFMKDMNPNNISADDLTGLPLLDQDGNRIGEVRDVSFTYRYVHFAMDKDAYFNNVRPSVSMSFEVAEKEN